MSARPAGAWTAARQAGNLLRDLGEHAARFKFLIRDRDSRFTAVFDEMLAGDGMRIIKAPVAQGELFLRSGTWERYGVSALITY